jgi:hypothetical protein
MTKHDPTETMFKAEYEGERPTVNLTGPERQMLRQAKRAVIDRLHVAMLTQCALDGEGPTGLAAGGMPQHIVEFADRVGEEKAEVPRARFVPKPADVDDMPLALRLLDGLRKPYYKVVKMRALEEFARDEGETGPFPWEVIGATFGLSGRWAEDAYDAAIVQACRRAGILPMKQLEHGLAFFAVWTSAGWLTNVSTAQDPRAAVANLKTKSPVRPEIAFAIWVAGPPVAKRIFDGLKLDLRGLLSHGAWYKAHPDVLAEKAVDLARNINADWMIDDIPVSERRAA